MPELKFTIAPHGFMEFARFMREAGMI